MLVPSFGALDSSNFTSKKNRAGKIIKYGVQYTPNVASPKVLCEAIDCENVWLDVVQIGPTNSKEKVVTDNVTKTTCQKAR